MNYMEQVAQMLGVELEEEFYLKNTTNGYYCASGKNKTTFKLSDSGMQMKFVHNNDYEWCSIDAMLAEILTGSLEIVKKPCKPKNDEVFYTVNLKKQVVRDTFDDFYNLDVMRCVLGKYFQTKEEITPEVIEEVWKRCYGKYFDGEKDE